MDLGFCVLCWRRRKGFSQEMLARRAGLPRSHLAMIEAGRLDPTVSTLRRIAAGLGTTPGRLLDGPPDGRGGSGGRGPGKLWSRWRLDRVAAAVLGRRPAPAHLRTLVRRLQRMLSEKLEAAGVRRPPPAGRSSRTQRILQAEMGDRNFQALLKRIEKYLAAAGP